METNVERVITAVHRISCVPDVEQLRLRLKELEDQLIQVSPEELNQLQTELASRVRATQHSLSPLSEPKEVLLELLTYALVVATESVFLCVWACVLWGVTEVLKRIEPHMPHWAPEMFRYVEIAFALFILSKLFIVRAEVFEEAIRRMRRVIRAWTRRG
jgi:hypothetical protein